MKNSAQYAARLKKLCNRLKRQGAPAVKTEPLDPVTGLVQACLSEVTTENKARTALNKLRNHFVDFNELRVCRPDEVVEVVGKGYPQTREVAARILGLLRQIYASNHTLDLSNLSEGGKREAKAFLTTLEDATPYITARVMLHCFDGHAFPVHEPLLTVLRQEEAIAPDSDAADAQGFLERQIPAAKIRQVYALLRRFADGTRSTRANADRTKTKKTKTKKKTTKKKT